MTLPLGRMEKVELISVQPTDIPLDDDDYSLPQFNPDIYLNAVDNLAYSTKIIRWENDIPKFIWPNCDHRQNLHENEVFRFNHEEPPNKKMCETEMDVLYITDVNNVYRKLTLDYLIKEADRYNETNEPRFILQKRQERLEMMQNKVEIGKKRKRCDSMDLSSHVLPDTPNSDVASCNPFRSQCSTDRAAMNNASSIVEKKGLCKLKGLRKRRKKKIKKNASVGKDQHGSIESQCKRLTRSSGSVIKIDDGSNKTDLPQSSSKVKQSRKKQNGLSPSTCIPSSSNSLPSKKKKKKSRKMGKFHLRYFRSNRKNGTQDDSPVNDSYTIIDSDDEIQDNAECTSTSYHSGCNSGSAVSKPSTIILLSSDEESEVEILDNSQIPNDEKEVSVTDSPITTKSVRYGADSNGGKRDEDVSNNGNGKDQNKENLSENEADKKVNANEENTTEQVCDDTSSSSSGFVDFLIQRCRSGLSYSDDSSNTSKQHKKEQHERKQLVIQSHQLLQELENQHHQQQQEQQKLLPEHQKQQQGQHNHHHHQQQQQQQQQQSPKKEQQQEPCIISGDVENEKTQTVDVKTKKKKEHRNKEIMNLGWMKALRRWTSSSSSSSSN